MTTPNPENDPVEFILNDFSDTGANINILPAANSSFYLQLNECGNGTLSVPASSNASSLLESGQLVIVKYRGAIRGGFFVEEIKETIASSEEGGGLWKQVSGRGLLALLDDSIVWPDAAGSGSRGFTGTKAAILYNLIIEASNRGAWIPTPDFDGTNDSESVAWTDSELMEFSAGKSMLDVAIEMAEMGIDINSTVDSAGSITLSAYKNEFGSVKTTTVYFRTGVNCTEISSNEMGGEIRNALAVKYANGFLFTNDTASIAARRRRESVIDAQDAGNAANALNYGNALLEFSKDPKTEISVRVDDSVGPRVFIDYALGDYITLDDNGTEAPYRIRNLLLKWDENEKASVVVGLNSTIFENEIRMSRNIKKLQEKWRRDNDAGIIIMRRWVGLTLSTDTGVNVSAIAYDSVNNTLYVGGVFTEIGGVEAHNLAKYDIASATWSAFGPATLADDVNCLCIIGDNLFIGGLFTNFDGMATADYIVKYTISTDTFSSMGGRNAEVKALAGIGDSLYVGGYFDDEGIANSRIALYTISTDTWSGIGGSSAVDGLMTGAVWTLLLSDGVLYVGGNFVNADTIASADKIVKYTISGGTWASMGGGLDNTVTCLAISDDTLFVGGMIQSAYSDNPILKYSITGNSWSNPDGDFIGTLSDPVVYALAVIGDDLYVGGNFSSVAGDSDWNKYTARYSITGGTWASCAGHGTSWISPNDNVFAMTAVGTDVYTGGEFIYPSPMVMVLRTTVEGLIDDLLSGGNSSVRWGNITGTLANQDDLVAVLALKAPYMSLRRSWFLRGRNSGGVVARDSNAVYNGSYSLPISGVKTANYTATAADYTILCDGTFTVYLPTAVGITGRIYVIKNISGSTTIDGNGSETIDGSATLVVGNWAMVQSDGANWYSLFSG